MNAAHSIFVGEVSVLEMLARTAIADAEKFELEEAAQARITESLRRSREKIGSMNEQLDRITKENARVR